jgi:D-amino-acid dehydrogenase
MRVLVMGAGIVGACSAYYLAREGHSVTVVDRHAQPATEASWGNAGVITPSQVYSMASPKIWKMIRQAIFEKSGPLKFKLPPDAELIPWMMRFATYCTAARSAELTRRKYRLAVEAVARYREIVAATGISFEDHVSGSLNVFSSESAIDAAWDASKVLRDEGLTLERLGRDQILALEPVLGNDDSAIAGGLLSRVDWSGNPAVFTRRLLEYLEAHYGVRTILSADVTALDRAGDRIAKVRTSVGDMDADAYVAAFGSNAGRILATVGVRVPIYPVKGYSITIPSRSARPRLDRSIIDASRRLALARIGSAIRVTFRAEFVGFDMSIDAETCRPALDYVKRLFDNSLDYGAAVYWTGFRPMTPDGLPVVGKTRIANLFVNAGHGHLGWTMAPVTAQRLAEIVGAGSGGTR